MSRESVRKRTRNFVREGQGWDREKSRRAGPRVGYIHGEQFDQWTRVDVTDNPQMGVRNRSGERRRTNKRYNDL